MHLSHQMHLSHLSRPLRRLNPSYPLRRLNPSRPLRRLNLRIQWPPSLRLRQLIRLRRSYQSLLSFRKSRNFHLRLKIQSRL